MIRSITSQVRLDNASALDAENMSVAMTTAGDLITRNATTFTRIGIGAANTRLTSNGTSATWVADTQNTAINAKGDLLAGTADNTLANVSIGANNTRLVADSAISTGMKWVADTQNTVVDAIGDLLVGSAPDTLTKLSIGATGDRLTVSGGTAAWTADTQNTVIDAKGDLLVGTADNTVAKLTVGTDNKVLTANSSATTGVSWETPYDYLGLIVALGG